MRIRSIISGIMFICAAACGVCAEPVSPKEYREMALQGFDILSDTTSTPERLIEGLELTRRAADGGDAVALNNLGYLAQSGLLEGTPGLENDSTVKKSPQRAAEYYTAAMGRRMTSAAMNLLTLLTEHPDIEVPRESVSEAHLIVGRAYALGNTVLPYSFEQSQRHFLESAKLGNEEAKRIIQETIEMFPDSFSEEELQSVLEP